MHVSQANQPSKRKRLSQPTLCCSTERGRVSDISFRLRSPINMEDEWLVELNEIESAIPSNKLTDIIAEAESLPKGRLWIGKDGGARPWWHRLLGTQKRYVDSIFSLEWFSEGAALIFHDENWREYRALKPENSTSLPESVRIHISHGEAQPAPDSECITKELAFKAIKEVLESGSRPKWLNYRFVE